MRFSDPLWLLALGLVPLFWLIDRSGISAVSRRQRKVALGVRIGIVVLVVLALSGLAFSLPERRLATVFVVDVSDSVAAPGRAEAETFLQDAIEAKPDDALAGVVAFGGDARVELTMQDQPELVSIASRPDPSRTDVARALRLAAALMPEGARRRVVLISDGRENVGDARAEAESLDIRRMEVDTVSVSGGTGPDSAVLRVDAPARVRVDETFDIQAVIGSNTSGPGTLVVRRGSRVVERREITVEPGEQRIDLKGHAGEPGSLTYRVELQTASDSVAQNDSAASLTLVSGKPRIVVVQGSPGEGAELVRALEARGLIVRRATMGSFPSGEEMASLDSIVLVDVPATAFTEAQIGSLEGFVRDLGRGLVTVGGEASWSLGDYRDSRLEALLPLNSDIKDPRRRPAIAQVLAIDTSGSMTACHCNPDGMGSREEGGVNKTDISRSAAARAIEALTAQDEVGILAFNTRSRFVVPLSQLPPDEVVREGLESLQPRGGTNIPQALKEAVEALKTSKASLKHIVMFTDGFTNTKTLVPAAREVRKSGITLSVLATGEGPGDELEKMAEAGGGRFYAGRNLHEIPELLMNEVVIATRRYINEGVFYPKIIGSSAATEALTSTPPLLGYVGTSQKSSASVLMAAGKYDDPLLATWRTGLGIATSWTSDAKSRWSRRWVDWEGFADFWSDVVRETLPAAAMPGFSSRAFATTSGVEVTVEAEDEIPEGTSATARVVTPDGETHRIVLSRSGLTSFEGIAPAGPAGVYLVSVALEDEGRSLYRETVGAVRSYSAEYQPGPADETFLREVASSGGGRYSIEPADSFDPDLPSGRRTVEVTNWLVLLAALLFPVDVALRRVILTRDDIAAAKAWRPGWWGGEGALDGPRTDTAARDAAHVGQLLKRKEDVVEARKARNAPPTPDVPLGPTAPEEHSDAAASPEPKRRRLARKKAPSPPPAAPEEDASHVSQLLKRKRETRGDE